MQINIKKNVEHFFSNKSIRNEDIKKKIFNGKILILEGFISLNNILSLTKDYFHDFFGESIDNVIKKKINKQINEKSIKEFQNFIKDSSEIRNFFIRFMKEVNFDIKDTYADKITFRYSPKKNEKSIGLLKPALPHRDTWASCIQNQINWWLPLHNVTKQNSIFFLPDYFSMNVLNNSGKWSFDEFKKKKNYPSSPYSNHEFKNKDFLKINLKVGQVLCFSGHHIHGSQIGGKRRLNLETRTFCSKDNIKFKIPLASDNSNKQIKFNWFKSLYDDSKFKS